MDIQADFNDPSTGRIDHYSFNIKPLKVPKIVTKFRQIITEIPPKKSVTTLNESKNMNQFNESGITSSLG